MPPLLKILGWRALLGFGTALVLVGALHALYAKGRADGRADCEASHKTALAETAERVRAAEHQAADIVAGIDAALAARLGDIRIEHITITRNIRDEVREVPIYSECRLSQRMFDNLNLLRAATDPGAHGGAEPALPAPAAPR